MSSSTGWMFLAPDFPSDFRDFGFLKAGLVNKDWSKGDIEYLNIFYVFSLSPLSPLAGAQGFA